MPPFVLLCASLVCLDVPQCVLRCILVYLGHQTLGSCKLGAIVSATWKCATTTHCICHLLKLPSPPRLTFPYDLLLLLPTHPLAFPPSNSYPLTFSSLGFSSLSFLSSLCSALSAHPPPSPPPYFLLCYPLALCSRICPSPHIPNSHNREIC